MVRTSRTTGEHRAGYSKRPDFSPAQPWRLLHPPALSLPRQPLRPGTRLIPCKAATPRLTLGFTVPGSEARTPLADFFSNLLCAGETGKVSWMQEPHREGVASRSDLESCAVVREGAREALTEAGAGWVWSREMATLRGADMVAGRGRPHPLPRQRERQRDPARSETPRTSQHTVLGNREIPPLSAADRCAERMGKSKDPRP